MDTEKRELNIRHWNQLSREQLEYVLTESANADKGRVNIYLYLSGLKIETEDVMPEDYDADMSMEECGEWLDTIQGLLDGTKVCLRPLPDPLPRRGRFVDTICRWLRLSRYIHKPSLGEGSGRLYCSTSDLAYASISQLDWLEKDHTLLSLPFSTMKIGRHTYKMPDTLLVNTKYQQYSNAQNYMVQYWQLLKRVIPPTPEGGEENKNDNDSKNKLTPEQIAERKRKRMKKKKEKPWTPPTEEEVKQIAAQMLEARKGFLASMLTPYRWKVKPRYPFLFREPSWDAESEQEMQADMAHAPMWLFDAVYKQWQDNIERFRKKFPDMFSEAKEDPRHDAFIAELGTINLVIEKGGYNNASAVYDENCVFIFKLLNDQIKEAKEMEKINKRPAPPSR